MGNIEISVPSIYFLSAPVLLLSGCWSEFHPCQREGSEQPGQSRPFRSVPFSSVKFKSIVVHSCVCWLQLRSALLLDSSNLYPLRPAGRHVIVRCTPSTHTLATSEHVTVAAVLTDREGGGGLERSGSTVCSKPINEPFLLNSFSVQVLEPDAQSGRKTSEKCIICK